MKKQLWIRLRKYRFDNLGSVGLIDRIKSMFGEEDPFTRAFAVKIAKKHDWTEQFAFLAIREYKKFVYLGTISHYNVTPPRIIDVVWHEHQLFTRAYREFCQNVLGKHFDHSPELLPFDEQTELFSGQYLKTLAFYESEFGCEPPAEIWGKPKFNTARINRIIKTLEKQREDISTAMPDGDIPLFTMFNSTADPDVVYAPIQVKFVSGGGGEYSGGGASGDWAAQEVSATQPAPGPEVAGSNATDAGTAAPAMNCSSGSSCGSSCGGGCSSS